jgi:hypothetical protein
VNRDHSAKVSPLSKRGLHGAWEVRDPQDPQTPEEWQECVNLAAGWRQVADCKMYGLVQGGPDIDVRRCDQLLERGRQRGVFPSRSTVELAVAAVASWNSESGQSGQGVEIVEKGGEG